jgi:putrescine transport system substrate-binding protein
MTVTRRKALKLAASSTLFAMPFVHRAKADDAILNMYNWADYIGETTIEDFQKATGIAVTYDTYNSTDEMQAKMLAGSTGYDVVDMAGLNMARFVAANIFSKLDKSKLPNWKNLDPDILKIGEGFDPGFEHGMPYMWGSVGFTYDVDAIKQRLPGVDLESMDMFMKPENAAKLADCGISILDEPSDVIPLILDYLGKPRDTYNPEDLEAVKAAFKQVRQHVRTFDSSNYLNAIANKELCFVNNWSGDYATSKARAKEANLDLNLAYFVPKSGAPAWFDLFCIPADSPRKDNAHTFLNYMMEPEVIAKCTDFTNYANANLASKPFVSPDVLGNPAAYPSADVMKRLYTLKPLSEEADRKLTETFTAMKSDS